MIFNQQGLSESEVKLLVKAADNVYQNQMSLDGWQVITPDLTNPNYGLNSELITGNIFRAEGDFLNYFSLIKYTAINIPDITDNGFKSTKSKPLIKPRGSIASTFIKNTLIRPHKCQDE